MADRPIREPRTIPCRTTPGGALTARPGAGSAPQRPGVGQGPHAREEPGVGAPGGAAKPPSWCRRRRNRRRRRLVGPGGAAVAAPAVQGDVATGLVVERRNGVAVVVDLAGVIAA